MDTLKELNNELRAEYKTTKKFFETFPEEKNDYKPHKKSTSLVQLATHIAEIFAWPALMIQTDKLDFAANDYQPAQISGRENLVKVLEDGFNKSRQVLQNANPEVLNDSWSINQGDQVLMKWSKYGAIRHALNQITHHRAQLGVYYRLLDIAVPSSYGPSADEANF